VKTIEELKILADRGNEYAKRELADRYYEIARKHIDEENDEALDWLKAAAALGHKEAQGFVDYVSGEDEELNKFNFDASLRKATDGNRFHQESIAHMYLKGKKGAVDKNEEKAIEWFKKSAEGDDGRKDAMLGLGEIYQTRGNLKESYMWYKKAAGPPHNDPIAMLRLSAVIQSSVEEDTAKGILREKKLSEAIYWCGQAIKFADKAELVELAQNSIDVIKGRVSSIKDLHSTLHDIKETASQIWGEPSKPDINNAEIASSAPVIINASEPHMALVFLLDTSATMKGEPIRQLNDGLNRFKREVCQNKQTRDILDVAIIEFNSSYSLVQKFVPVEYMAHVDLYAAGRTVMVPAVEKALAMVTERSRFYRLSGTEPYKPWIILISDGEPSDDITYIAREIKEMEKKQKVSFRSLGVGGYDAKTLHTLSGPKVMKLQGTDFTHFFDWVNKSMRAISQSSPGEKPIAEKLTGNVVVDTDWD